MALYQKLSISVTLAITTLCLLPSQTNAGVGRVTEQTGPTEIVRARQSIASAVNTTVEMNDTIVTARARAELTFEDSTKVKITEQSKLVIDDFVYDPRQGTGKLAMKVAMGTARLASGQIAKNNPQQVAIKTPTASIAVRGTDFSMTVDELGRSLIMLLPSCDDKSCVTGQIEVSNEAGSVLMTQAYQATLVTAIDRPPSSPVIVSIDQLNINNMLIVSRPREIDRTESDNKRNTASALDFNFLDQDFLRAADLENQLDAKSGLDRNYLDNDFLENVLDAFNQALFASQESLSAQNQMLPGYNAGTGLKWYVDGDEKLHLYKAGSSYFEVIVHREHNLILDAVQDSVPVYQRINTGGTTVIRISQSNQ